MHKLAGFFLLLFVPLLYCQDAPSLADLARRARAEKDNSSSAIQTSTAPAPAPTGKTTDKEPGQSASKPATPVKDPETTDEARIRQHAEADARNLHENDDYEKNIRTLFNVENFQEIDRIADKARSEKTRLHGGFWAIHLLYVPLTKPLHETESEWKIHLDRLQSWVEQRPQSITARVALAGSYLQYAWNARGGGYASGVTEEGWQLFGDRSAKAGKILIDAFNLPTKDPEWFLTMQFVMQAQNMTKQQQTAMFEKAVAFEPDYQYYYRAEAAMLLPQWEGEEGEMALFAKQAADRIGGKKGDMIYFQIGEHVNCSCEAKNQPNGMSWPRIKRGYAAVEEQYGLSLIHMNKMAKFAAAAGDADYAHELFTRIGENWDEDTWQTRENFESVRDWAGFDGHIKNTVEEGTRAAEENLKTEYGRIFKQEIDKTFRSNFSDIVAACKTLAHDPTLTTFDLVLQIGKTGSIEQSFSNPFTKTALCVQSSIANSHFPAPPEPSYWVKITVGAQH